MTPLPALGRKTLPTQHVSIPGKNISVLCDMHPLIEPRTAPRCQRDDGSKHGQRMFEGVGCSDRSGQHKQHAERKEADDIFLVLEGSAALNHDLIECTAACDQNEMSR